MSIFSKILGKIFPSSHPAVSGQAPGAQGGAATPPQGPTAPAGHAGTPSPAASADAAAGAPVGAPAPAAAATPAAAPAQPVDVEAVLAFMAANQSQALNWKTSIVDLLKLLDLDSSLAARKELAKELGYSGDTGDSAAMNIWLHRQVMNKLAENGGRVPDELRH